VTGFTGDGNNASWLRTLHRELRSPVDFDHRGQREAANEIEVLKK
jgi:hypothetical protein